MFILSEDLGLRKRLEGMVVSDQTSAGADTTRKVGVWFGQPDQEIRAQSYPYVTIDMIDVVRDTDREHRGVLTAPDYMSPSSEFDSGSQSTLVDYPIPVSLFYQITTYARHPRHDRAILAQLMATKLPIRSGSIELDDGTVRRLDVEDISKRDVTEQAKRLFINAITVRISSEVVLGTLEELYKVNSVKITDIINMNARSISSLDGRYGLGDVTFGEQPEEDDDTAPDET
jgi:hypothetical protein